VDDYPPHNSAWDYEWHQRNCIVRGLTNCKNDDTIIISDIDEIPNPEIIIKYKDCPGINVLKQKMFYYYLNKLDLKEPYWTASKMLSFGEFVKNDSNSQKIRHLRGRLINNGGWHFSYLGGAEKIAEKIQSFSHQEFNSKEYTDLIKIREKIENGEDLFGKSKEKRYAGIEIDESYPKYIVNNANSKYKCLVCNVDITFSDKLRLFINEAKNNVFAYIRNYLLRNHINKANFEK
jgi:beta-1,4-mannosyl-glycoprotein beta-1,4-N-acetylglucosaminyltransferase